MNGDQKRTFLFVILAGLVLFTWQLFFAPQKTSVTELAKEKVIETRKVEAAKNEVVQKQETQTENNTNVVVEEQTITLSNENHSITFDNFLRIKDFKNSNSQFNFESTIGHPKESFKVQVAPEKTKNFRDLQFQFSNISETSVEGFDPAQNVKVILTLSEDGRVNLALNSTTAYSYRLFFGGTNSDDEKHETNNHKSREFVFFSSKVLRAKVGKTETGEGALKWAGVDYNYHLFSIILKDKPNAVFNAYESGDFFVELTTPATSFSSDLVFLKKDYDKLMAVGDKLELSVDFGFFGIIAVPILRGLQFFYNYVGNYGLAIIVLTFVIRMLMFPLQYKSFKSMKKMQKVQPELQKLREKFKDDPARMQKETMELFKKSGANPLGGCLPLILQMPVFFAFYQVLYNAVELVGAPFYLWIFDLSQKDPYYVLPVLMGIAMFGQTKLNPSASADPNQQKIMYIMPLIFCFMMKDLPAGLNLYIFVSTVFGIAQQLYVYKSAE